MEGPSPYLLFFHCLAVGDTVAEDEVVCEIETDKVICSVYL